MQRIRLNIFICLTKKKLISKENKNNKTKQKMQSLNKSLKGFGLQLQPQLLCNHAIRGHCNYSMLSMTKWQLRRLISHVIASVSLQIFCTDTFLFFVMDHLIFTSLPFFPILALTLLSFFLPPDSGERITLVITNLLAMTVFMLIVAEIMPATSEVVPLISIYYTGIMFEVT